MADSTYIDPESGIPLTAIDREVLATKDEDFHLVTWEELKHVIGEWNWQLGPFIAVQSFYTHANQVL